VEGRCSTRANVVGVVAAKVNAMKFATATGDIPENVSFAIKTGAMRGFLDNSAISCQAADSGAEPRAAEIANKARGARGARPLLGARLIFGI